jgi:hypothetical protein
MHPDHPIFCGNAGDLWQHEMRQGIAPEEAQLTSNKRIVGTGEGDPFPAGGINP